MNVARLRTLRELSLRKTMAAAATALLISPSAVSQQISQLEDEVGAQLVERRGRGVQFTPAGEILVRHAERIVAVLEDAKIDLAEMKRIVAGELRVAAFPSVAAPLVPTAIRALGCLHPRLRVTFDEMEPTDSLTALRAWEVDVALIDDMTAAYDLHQANIETIELLEDLLYVMIPSSHALASKDIIEVGDLRGEVWALDTNSHAYSNTIVRKCQAAGFEPVINARYNGFEVVHALVEAGCSVSVQPGLRLRGHLGKVAFRKLVPEIRRKILLAFRQGEHRSPAIMALVHQLQESVITQRLG